MPRTSPRTTRLCDHIDEAGHALIVAMERTCAVLTGEPVTPDQRRAIVAAFRDCQRALRVVQIDGEEINAATRLIKALAHTFALTPDVARAQKEMQEDLARLRGLAFVHNLEEMFPEIAA